MAHVLHARHTARITDLKRDPSGTVEAGDGRPVAIFKNSKPSFYCVPAATFEDLMQKLEDFELGKIVATRKASGKMVSVTLDDL